MAKNSVQTFITRASTIWGTLRSSLFEALHWHYTPHLVGGIVATLLIRRYVLVYLRWRRGWLSYLVEKRITQLNGSGVKRRIPSLFRTKPRPRLWVSAGWHGVLAGTRSCISYIYYDFRRDAVQLYMPTIASVFVLSAGLIAVALITKWPKDFHTLLDPSQWWPTVDASLDHDEGESLDHYIEALVAIIVALIVFVAESIRSSKSQDEKRVLLRISRLWVLVMLIILIPAAFLYMSNTGVSIALTLFMSIVSLWGFAQVLRNLLDPGASLAEQRTLLSDRVGALVQQSARQRVGNKLLFDLLGRDSDSGVQIALSTLSLKGGKQDYQFVAAPRAGIIDDIDIENLKRLGQFLATREAEARTVAAPGQQGNATTGQAGNAPQANASQKDVPRSYLMQLYRAQISDDEEFGGDQRLIAIPKSIAKRDGVLEEVRGIAKTAFRFSRKEPSSAAFRRELESTRDRLLKAIKSASRGEIEELRGSYVLVAEQFLRTLADLGGIYTADDAKKERNDWLSGWDEVKWLRDDVRDALKAAADTQNADVVRIVVALPYIIAVRAFQAGDNLLFQEFLSFASYIYLLGIKQPEGSETGKLLMDRASTLVREILDYSISPAIREGADDED